MLRFVRVVVDFFVYFLFVDKVFNVFFKIVGNKGKLFGGIDFVCVVLFVVVENKGLNLNFFIKYLCFIIIY